MPSINISNGGLRDFPKTFNGKIETLFQNVFSGIDKRVSLYSVGSTHTHQFTNKKELYIFNYSTQKVEGQTQVHVINDAITVFGKTIVVEKMFEPVAGGVLIGDENGMIIAQYFFEHKVINIFIDLLGNPDEDKLFVLGKIAEVVANMIREEGDEESWVKAKNKAFIIGRTREMIREQHNQRISDSRSRIQTEQSNIESYRMELTKSHTKLAEAMRIVEDSEGVFIEKSDKLIADMELLAQFHMIEDLRIEGKFIHIHTKDIIITEPTKGHQYQGGKYIIKVRMSDSKITFHGASSNGRRGYWTSHDPHPHVNGDNGNACLGSIAPTIAELCSQEQIYALGIVLISFLESVNIDDSAGKKVVNWPRYNPANPDAEFNLDEEETDEEYVDETGNDEETDGEE